MTKPRTVLNREDMTVYRKALQKIIGNGITKGHLESLGGGTIKKSDIDNFINRKSGTTWSTKPIVAIANLIDEHFKEVLADVRNVWRIPVLEEIERAAHAPGLCSPVDLQGLYTGVQKDRYGYRVLMLEVRKFGPFVYYQAVTAAGRSPSAANTGFALDKGVLFLTDGEIGMIGGEDKLGHDFGVLRVPDSSMGKVWLWSAAATMSRGGKSLVIVGNKFSRRHEMEQFYVEQHSDYRSDTQFWVLEEAIAKDLGVYEGSLREELSFGIKQKQYGFDDVAGLWEMHSFMEFDASGARKHFKEGIEVEEPIKPAKKKTGAKKAKK